MNNFFQTKFGISKNNLFMGLVSLFNDMSTEMMYPILSIFLSTTLQSSPAVVGLIQAVTRAVEHILLVLFGWLSDRFSTRKPFIMFGYMLSCFSKGLIGVALNWQIVMAFLFIDRLGKSIRTSPRDALIAGASEPLARGRAFGFHRTADTLGAVAGPLLTMFYLSYVGSSLRPIFFLTIIPALIAVVLLAYCVKENFEQMPSKKQQDFYSVDFSFTRDYYFLLIVSMIFYLGSGVEVFFILRSHDLGFAVSTTVFLYMIYNLVYALSSFPLGIIADMIGHKSVLTIGFFLFALISFLFGIAQTPPLIAVLFALHGLYMALTEGIIKAYISHLVPLNNLGFAFGFYSTMVGICMFIGICGAGLLWTYISVAIPFFIGAFFAASAAAIFLVGNAFESMKVSR